MENQHRQIKGYRELSQAEIDLMNRIKEKGAELQELLSETHQHLDAVNKEFGTPDAEHRRWCAIAKTHFQEGLMALTRAVAKPDFF